MPENLSNQGQHGEDFGGVAEDGVIGGCWHSKAYYHEVHFMIC